MSTAIPAAVDADAAGRKTLLNSALAPGTLMQGVAAGLSACTRRGVVPALPDGAAVRQLAGTLTKAPA